MRHAVVGFFIVAILVALSFVGTSTNGASSSGSDSQALAAFGVSAGLFPPAIVAESYGRLTKDASASGVAAVVQARETMRSRGPHEAINFFQTMLVDTKDIAVHRAIRFELASLYRETGQNDKAMEQLKILMTNTDR